VWDVKPYSINQSYFTQHFCSSADSDRQWQNVKKNSELDSRFPYGTEEYYNGLANTLQEYSRMAEGVLTS